MEILAKRLKTFGLATVATVLMAAPALAQAPGPGPGGGPGPGFRGFYGPHMMGGWGGWHHGGFGFGHGFILLLALIGFVAVVLGVIRAFRGRCWHHRHHQGMGAGLEIVETRYARGEIGRDEYLEKKRDLSGRA